MSIVFFVFFLPEAVVVQNHLLIFLNRDTHRFTSPAQFSTS